MGDEWVFTFKKEYLRRLFNPEYLIIAFFILAAFLYLKFDGLPLTHPGNLKASDTFAHVLAVEKIIDTKQWNLDDLYLSAGIANMSTVQPPLYYTNAALLTMYTGIPAWVTFYLLVCISQAFFVILVYLITKEVFDNQKISLIASGLTVLPIPISVWLYPTSIGIWIQVCGYSIMMFYFWMFIRYLKTKENWTLLFMGISISSLIMTHTADIYILFLPTLFIGLIIFLQYIVTKDLKKFIKKSLLLALIPSIVILLLLPKFLFVWRGYAGGGGQAYMPGLYNPTESMFAPVNGVASLVFPHLLNIPTWQFVMLGIGVFCIFIFGFYTCSFSLEFKEKVKFLIKKNKKISLSWLLVTAYFFFFIYYAEYFLYKPYYIGRMRSLQPYLLYPFIAYGIYLIINFFTAIVSAIFINGSSNIERAYSFFEENKNIIHYTFIIFLLISIFNSVLPSYRDQVNMMKYEHVSLGQWEAYKFIQANSKLTDKVLFFGSHDQSEGLYVKRPNGILNNQQFQNYLNSVTETYVPLNFTIGGWGGSTPRSNIIEINYWKYLHVPDPSNNVSIHDFDFIFFMDEMPGMKEINDFFIYHFSINGFILVFDKNGYRVMKNERYN